MSDLLGLLVAFGLVAINAFFVAAGFALVSVRGSRIEALVEEGNASAEIVRKAIRDLDRYVAATQLGTAVASLALGWVGEPTVGRLIAPLVEAILLPFFPDLSDEATRVVTATALGGLIAFIITTTVLMVMGELVPKSVALQNPERTSLIVARPTLWAARLLRWPVSLLNGLANALLRVLGVQPAPEHRHVLSIEELKILVRNSEEVGVLQEDEREIIDAVFDIRRLVTRQVMIPRTEMYMVSADAPIDELVRLTIETPYTRFPVYDKDADHIIGVLHLKDLMAATVAGDHSRTARTLAAETVFVPESLPVVNLLQLLRERGEPVAMVYDEFGGTEGMVTLGDILGKLVGELPDRYEFDQRRTADGTGQDEEFTVNGLMLIEDFNEEFGFDLSDENYNTIGGYVMGRLQRIPQVGDVVEVPGAMLRVDTMDELRIDRLGVLLTRSAHDETPPNGNDDRSSAVSGGEMDIP